MNGLGQIGADSPILNQANGLGNVVQPQQEQQTYGRKTSLDKIEHAKAEKMKEKERDKEHDMIKKIEELNSKERMEFMKAKQNSYISGSAKPTNEINYAQ